MLIIGLMSGTSVDGIDAALVDVRGSGRRLSANLLAFTCIPYPQPTRDAILRACQRGGTDAKGVCILNTALAEKFADAAHAIAREAGVGLGDVRVIASHGQTIWHQPDAEDLAGVSARATLQIGNPAVIARRTGCSVVSDFRAADMAAGGQGAPLVAFAKWALLTSTAEARAIQNIGGIANVTYLPRDGQMEEVLAFDTGPGNMLMDATARELSGGRMNCDTDGAWAGRGTPCRKLLDEMLDHPFFCAPPPRTTGRETFGAEMASAFLRRAREEQLSPEDTLATATALTAESIARAYRDWLAPRGPVDTVIVGGGGAHNRTLMRMLSERLSPSRILRHEDVGIRGDAKEAIAFAVLAHETLHGRPSNVPSATGAVYPAILGNITPAPVH